MPNTADEPTFEQKYRFTHRLRELGNNVNYIGSSMTGMASITPHDMDMIGSSEMLHRLEEFRRSIDAVDEELLYIMEPFNGPAEHELDAGTPSGPEDEENVLADDDTPQPNNNLRGNPFR